MPDHFFVYPAYLEKGISRRGGRRIAAGEAVGEVTIEAIASAASSLGFKVEAEPAKQYPREAHRFQGRVKVQKRSGVSKTAALRQIAKALQAAAAKGV